MKGGGSFNFIIKLTKKMGDKNTASIEVSQSEIEKDKAFLKEYSELCEKHSRIIQVEPAFILRDDKTYSISIKTSVAKK